jgi:hypothetical protein
MRMNDFLLQEYEDWKKGLKTEDAAVTEDNRVHNHRFFMGDVVPKQGYKTVKQYWIPEVPPDEYMKLSNSGNKQLSVDFFGDINSIVNRGAVNLNKLGYDNGSGSAVNNEVYGELGKYIQKWS